MLTGADRGAFERRPGRHPYARSLPLAKALHKDTILAYEMNGEPIPPEHGGPVRAIVPGWYATDSVKWVERVHVVQAEFDGPFQALDYRFATAADPGLGERMERMPVHALITAPGEGSRLAAGPVAVRGAAWSGAGAVTSIEVRIDDGRWHEAAVTARTGRYGRTLWEYDWAAEPGAAHDRRPRPRRQRRGATLRAGLEPARLCQQLRPPRRGDGRGGDLMATFDRNAALANETVAADLELDAWLAQRDLGRESTRAELAELVRELAARPDLWRRHVRHSPVERLYVRLHLDDHLEVWLICWSQRQDTGFHDHDGSRGAVAVVDGALRERRLAVGGQVADRRVSHRRRLLVRGDAHPRRVPDRRIGRDVAARLLAAAGRDGLLRDRGRRHAQPPHRRLPRRVLLVAPSRDGARDGARHRHSGSVSCGTSRARCPQSSL